MSYLSILKNAFFPSAPSPTDAFLDAERENLSLERLLSRAKRIEIVSNRNANDLFSGQYKSAFRGQGIEFAETREYVEGDDVRTIDWNVTARAGKPYVKRFTEERERSLLFLLDVSASNLFGSKVSRLETMVEIAATLMFSALKNNDKVGLMTFANGVKDYFPPRKGKNYVLRLMREMLKARPLQEKTDLNAAVEYVGRVLKRRAILFVLSDFFVPDLDASALHCRRRCDPIAITVREPLETAFPNVGFATLRDPETNEIVELDTGSAKVRRMISERFAARQQSLTAALKEANVDQLVVDNGSDPLPVLREFFRRRARK